MELITIVRLVVLQILLFMSGELVRNVVSQMIHCSESDLLALLDFKAGLEDPQNRLSSWKGRECCEWRGISCDVAGAVVAVDLRNHHPRFSYDPSSSRYGFWNLSGEISPSLAKIKSLTRLDLSFNTFRGIPIPKFFANLKNLQYLNLSNAGFSGSIPLHIGNLSSLQYLDLEALSLVVSDLEWLRGLVSLKNLVMNSIDLSLVGTDWIRAVNKLPHLTELRLSNCGLFGPIPSLASPNFTSLAVVELNSNNFNSEIPYWLANNITSLETLTIEYSGLFGRIPLGFSELPNLKSLSLSGNDNLTASCSQLFSGRWEKIEFLDFSSSKLHDELPASLGNMTSLTYFDLFENNVQGGIPRSIGKLCNLKLLRLSGNNLTGRFPEFLEGAQICHSKTPLSSLQHLDLSINHLVGKLPAWLSQLKSLVQLSLDYNSLHGPIPASLGSLQNLEELGFSSNRLNGTLPESLGQLSELTLFDVSFNQLTGIVSETHFLKLKNLTHLHLSSNSLTLNFTSNWDPPFQAWYLDMGSCHLGPSFPIWLRSQKAIKFLDFSNASISDSLPHWFWNISSDLSLLNVSFNQLKGQLPSPLNVGSFADVDLSYNLFDGPIPLPMVEIVLLDLSNNKLSGPIPDNIGDSLPNLVFLSLSGNKITGQIPHSIGKMQILQAIDLSINNLSGAIPSSIANCSILKALDLSNNNLFGNIPHYIGDLRMLRTLHLSDNKLTGKIPSSFLNLSSLETLDLRNNKLTGRLPQQIGEAFSNLRVLSLRSNWLYGELPSVLSNLSSLQVLDLSENQFNGSVPVSFGDFEAMTRVHLVNKYLFFGFYRGVYYEDSLKVNAKGQTLQYTKTLSLLTSLDLSGNNLSGYLPEEVTKLLGLAVLNLSRNHIAGHIPVGISKLGQLLSLDLSSNRLTGPIPESLSSLSFLGHLNLSNNDLSGMVPYTGHLTTFDAASFEGNPLLCGDPLAAKCPRSSDGSNEGRDFGESNGGDGFVDEWFYLSVGLGFASGILVPVAMFSWRRSWRNAYFSLVDNVVSRFI